MSNDSSMDEKLHGATNFTTGSSLGISLVKWPCEIPTPELHCGVLLFLYHKARVVFV